MLGEVTPLGSPAANSRHVLHTSSVVCQVCADKTHEQENWHWGDSLGIQGHAEPRQRFHRAAWAAVVHLTLRASRVTRPKGRTTTNSEVLWSTLREVDIRRSMELRRMTSFNWREDTGASVGVEDMCIKRRHRPPQDRT